MTAAVALTGQDLSGGDADLLVPWWSFGKTSLSATALALVQEGLLPLDEPVDALGFTLRHLLQHTSGLPDYGGLADYHADVAKGARPWPVARLLDRAGATRLLFSPGQGWAYSNIGYMRVAELIARAAGAPLAHALRSRLFDPLGLATPRLARSAADLEGVRMGRASGYDPGWVYHGLIVGSLGDAARLLEGLMGASLLSAELLAEMRSLWPLPEFRDPLFTDTRSGLGLMRPAPGVFGHTGSGPGSSLAVYRFEDRHPPTTVAAFVETERPRDAEARAFELGRG